MRCFRFQNAWVRAAFRSVSPVALLALILVNGCATAVIPPRNPVDPVAVYLTNYGRHSSIILHSGDGQLKEFSFGDYNWFAVSHNTLSDALQAFFRSPGSTLGRRVLDSPDDPAGIQIATGARTVRGFDASRRKVDRLIDDLDETFTRELDTVTYNPRSGLWFVRVAEPYSAWHNCNHVTARWLRRLDCRVRGTAAFSNFKIRH
jgi:hypothetical protein